MMSIERELDSQKLAIASGNNQSSSHRQSYYNQRGYKNYNRDNYGRGNNWRGGFGRGYSGYTKTILRMRIHVAVLGVVDPELVIAVALAALVLTEVMPQTGQTSL